MSAERRTTLSFYCVACTEHRSRVQKDDPEDDPAPSGIRGVKDVLLKLAAQSNSYESPLKNPLGRALLRQLSS